MSPLAWFILGTLIWNLLILTFIQTASQGPKNRAGAALGDLRRAIRKVITARTTAARSSIAK